MILVKSILGSKYLVESHGTVTITKGKTDNVEMMLDFIKDMEYEGLVLKMKAYDKWWKIKTIREADVFVTGFKVSKSETRFGLITSVCIGALNADGDIVDMGRVSGFKEDEMLKILSVLVWVVYRLISSITVWGSGITFCP